LPCRASEVGKKQKSSAFIKMAAESATAKSTHYCINAQQ